MNAVPPVPPPVIGRRTWAAAALGALAAPLLFALASREVWEDYFITYRSSRHLAGGHGLVYQVGEAVHTFTSPLGVLLPALGYVFTGSDGGALWFLRIVSALALAGTALLVANHARDHGWKRTTLWFALCLGLFEAKVVAFSANGMETGLLVFFAALTWHELTRPGGLRWRGLALAYAGLMWTRPDAFVLAGAMTGAWWLFRPRTDTVDSARTWWLRLGGALLLGAALYLPWILWAWQYYGSPVPQTIIAKSALTPGGLNIGRILAAPFGILVQNTALDGLFTPIYATTTGWPLPLLIAGRVLARIAAFLWLVPFVPRPARAASLTVLLGGIYFHQIMPYPWYFAPWTLLGALALAGGGRAMVDRLPAAGARGLCLLAAIIAGGCLLVTVAQTYAARQQQRIIEEGGRQQIGLWLKEHARPTDRVFLEPIGYIGYYSQLKILDFPGLCAPEVSRIVRSGPGGYARIITTLQPDWLVLRPYEIESQNLLNSGILNAYVGVGHWDQRAEIDALNFLPGRNWLVFDAEFYVFRRRTADWPK
ncbi:MAG: hypothetical protein PSU94_04515 [Lacunisphaera sp.]|nr:hypothetical protein [Lacunisphaera sp.]